MAVFLIENNKNATNLSQIGKYHQTQQALRSSLINFKPRHHEEETEYEEKFRNI